jgi:hypothetical protein
MDNSTKNGIITIAAIGFLGLIAWKLMKNPNPNPMMNGGNTGGGNTGGGNTGGGNTSGGGTNDGGNTGGGGGTTTPSDLSSNQIRTIADDIFNAMDGYGTNEDSILADFKKLKTNNDFDNLVNAFGTRTVSSGTGNIFMSDFTGELSACLREELSSGWIADINAALRSNRISRSV